MNYTNGLAILRRVSPDRELEDWLDRSGELIAIDTGTGRDRKTILHVDDDIPRDDWVSTKITGVPLREGDPDAGMTGGCSDGWSIVDADNRIHGYYASRVRAEEAVNRARVTIVTDVELEDEEDRARPAKAKPVTSEPVAASA